MMDKAGKPLVSVIITTYNRSAFVRSAIQNVLKQTYPNIEIIVVDDASSDDTEQVVGQFGAQVTYVKKPHNQGLAAARNTGLQHANGELINFLDDDDLLEPTKIESQVGLLEARKDVGVAYCRHYHIDEGGRYIDEVGALPDGNVYNALVEGCFIVVHSALVRRECFQKVGFFNTQLPWEGQYCEDWEFWIRVARAGYSFGCVQEPLVAYRIHRGGMVANVSKEANAAFGMLDLIYQDPLVSPGLLDKKGKIYGYNRLWISARYYAAQNWPEAQRNLVLGFEAYPDFKADLQKAVQFLIDEALGARTSDPAQFIDDVFAHLPPSLPALQDYRGMAVGQVYFRLGLRSYREGDVQKAKDFVSQAVSVDPSILERLDMVANLIQHLSTSSRVAEPVQYIDFVFANLPPAAAKLKKARARVIGDASISRAFQDFADGETKRVVGEVVNAVRFRPQWLLNKGVWAIFLKSVFATR